MTITLPEAALYSGALFVLFLTPGPVWLALTARAMTGGFSAAWPVALGVVVGDVVWPLVAIFGISWVVSTYDGLMFALKWVASFVFMLMGLLLIRSADRSIVADSRLTRPGAWAGFIAGVAVILGNPKAVLFYLGILPGFFDLRALTTVDIIVICCISLIVPLTGNLALAAFIDRARRIVSSPTTLRRVNVVSGVLLITVSVAIAFS
ncbi:transporter, LysE family [gamma proteobacterium NOR5-3]|nr:transporter, LysE family [gamma proteobacterium NOR5-3]